MDKCEKHYIGKASRMIRSLIKPLEYDSWGYGSEWGQDREGLIANFPWLNLLGLPQAVELPQNALHVMSGSH